MSSNDHLEIEGIITYHNRGVFKVRLLLEQASGEDMIINTKISGRMRKNNINLVVGDSVLVKVSPYDLGNGIITRRLKS